MTNLLASLQANEKTVRAVCWALLAVFAGATFFVDNLHAHTWAERHVPFFWSFFGFGAAAVIIGVAAGWVAPASRPDRRCTAVRLPPPARTNKWNPDSSILRCS